MFPDAGLLPLSQVDNGSDGGISKMIPYLPLVARETCEPVASVDFREVEGCLLVEACTYEA